MTPEERARIIMATEAEEAGRLGGIRSLEYMSTFIQFHINDAIRENREAIARMVETWHEHGPKGYDHWVVYKEIAQAIREGKTCIHEWLDIRNKVVESGELCRHCGVLRAGNEASWKFRALDGLNPG